MVSVTEFISYKESVSKALEDAMLQRALENAEDIVIKPNLLQDSPNPNNNRCWLCRGNYTVYTGEKPWTYHNHC